MINQFSIKKQILLFSVLFVSVFNAQSIEDGVNFYFGQKYDSAKEIFQKNDSGDGVYWLGQVMIAQRASNNDVRKLYQEGLVKFPKSKLIKIGLSHVDILDGKLAEAKAIESAILEGSKNPDEYNAVARAHIQAGKKGDQGFVIEKLKPIYDNNKKKDVNIPLYLANAYLYKKNTSDATY